MAKYSLMGDLTRNFVRIVVLTCRILLLLFALSVGRSFRRSMKAIKLIAKKRNGCPSLEKGNEQSQRKTWPKQSLNHRPTTALWSPKTQTEITTGIMRISCLRTWVGSETRWTGHL